MDGEYLQITSLGRDFLLYIDAVGLNETNKNLIIRVTHPAIDDPVRMGCCPRAGIGQTFGQGIELVAAVEAPSPRDFHEHQAAEAAIRAMWREIRADRLEAQVLGDLFAAGELPDPAEADAAKTAAFKALNSLLRYRGRIEREHRQAMQALDDLRQRRLARTPALRPSEPEKTMPAAAPTEPSSAGAPRVATVPSASAPPTDAAAPPSTNAKPGEPEPARALNRHQRRALAAMSRRAA